MYALSTLPELFQNLPNQIVRLLGEARGEYSKQVSAIVKSAKLALKDRRRIDPYIFSILGYWQNTFAALASAKDEFELGSANYRFNTTRLSLLVALDLKQFGGDDTDPLYTLAVDSVDGGGSKSIWPGHLHSSVGYRLSVRSCSVNWDGLHALLVALAKDRGGVLAIELCTQIDTFDPSEWFERNLASQSKAPARSRAAVADIAPDPWEKRKAYLGRTSNRQARPAPLPTPDSAPPPVLVCVIDDLCNFASDRLTAHGKHPLIGLWHQGSDPATTRRLDAARHSGSVRGDGRMWAHALDNEEADAAAGPSSWRKLSGAVMGRRLREPPRAHIHDEAEAYHATRYLSPPPRFSHGSAVLDLICGPRDRLKRPKDACAPPPPDVLFVQLPVPSVLDTSGGSLASHALDGIHHALEATPPGGTVIVNLSYGSHSGPHDGSSLWDQALKELLDLFNGGAAGEHKTLHVVLPAGNGQRSRSHAYLHVRASSPQRSLRWRILPEDTTGNQLELWFPHGVMPTITLRSPLGNAVTLNDRNVADLDDSSAMLVLASPCAQSAHGTMALISLGATLQISRQGELWQPLKDAGAKLSAALFASSSNIDKLARPTPQRCPSGVWTIEVAQGQGQASKDFMFHAWVMRGDAAPMRRQARLGNLGRQSYLLDEDGEQVDPRYTLNGIASLEHERLWVVGAMRRADRSIASYSAAGPNRVSGHPQQKCWRLLGPNVVVTADESLNQPGLLVSGVMSGSRVRVSGTSIAAAAFTRHLYEHLAAGKPACTVNLVDPCFPSRISPTGNPYMHDASVAYRGESDRLQPEDELPNAVDGCPTNAQGGSSTAARHRTRRY